MSTTRISIAVDCRLLFEGGNVTEMHLLLTPSLHRLTSNTVYVLPRLQFLTTCIPFLLDEYRVQPIATTYFSEPIADPGAL